MTHQVALVLRESLTVTGDVRMAYVSGGPGVCVLVRRGPGAISGSPTPHPGHWPWFLEKLAFEQAGQERVSRGDPVSELYL